MVRVRIVSGVTAATGAALALTSVTGCAADTQDATSTGTENNTEAVAGSGTLNVSGWTLYYTSTSGGDEFVRVGEKMKVAVDYAHLVFLLCGYDDPALKTELQNDPAKLKLMLKPSYTKFDGSTYDAPLVPVGVKPGASNLPYASSEEFVIPKGVSRLRVEILAEYNKNGQTQHVSVFQKAAISQNEFVVFGAYVPNKLALFDTDGGARRMRVVEGGALVKGAKATLSYTDWRADTVVEKMQLDLRVGQKQSGSRFGNVTVDALGTLEYVVSAAISTDGGATFNPVTFTKKMRPDVMARSDGFRFAFESELGLPQNAGPSLKVAFHVQAFLQVPNEPVQNARYAPGARILLKDVWDNNGGQNYSLPIAAQ